MKRKRTLVPREKIEMPRVDAVGQMKLTDYFFALSHPLRLTIMRFLDRAKSSGFGIQSFTGIQKALEGSYHVVAAPNLNHHLNELKKVGFVDQVAPGNGTGSGYMLLDLGHQLLVMCKDIEDKVEKKGLWPNKYEDFVYREFVEMFIVPVKNQPHVTDIPLGDEARPFSPSTHAPEPVPGSRSRPAKDPRGPGAFSRLESFA